MQIVDSDLDLTDVDPTGDIERRIESHPEPKIFTWYINFELWKPGPFIIVLWWIGVIALGIFYGFDVLNLTTFNFDAPDGTDGAIAHQKMVEVFHSREQSQQLLLYYSCSICGAGNTAIESIETSQNNSIPIMYTMSIQFQEWFALQKPFLSYSDFYTTSAIYNNTNGNMTMLANLLFVSDSNQSSVAIVIFDTSKDQSDITDFIDDANDKCNEITNKYGSNTITVSMTGENAMAKAMTDQSRIDVGVNCLMLVPVALCVLALIIRSWRLMFIPVICFIISICASFSILRPFAEHVMDINPFCPAIMMAVTVAMSIDYSLFLLSRFVEEIERKQDNGSLKSSFGSNKELMATITREAVRQTTRWSGKVIALSGCILSLTFFGLLFFPMNLLQSVGLGSGLAVICTILVNLTCTPSIILIFPSFFSKFGWAGCPFHNASCCKINKHKDTKEQSLIINEPSNFNIDEQMRRISNPSIQDSIDLRVGSSSNHKHSDVNGCCERFWYKCSSKITICPWSLLIVIFVYAAIAPVGYQFLSFKQQLADTLIFPRNSAYVHTYNDIANDFSAGFLAPWNILIFAKDGDKVYYNPFEKDADMTYLTETGLIINETITKCFNNGYYIGIEGVGYLGGALNISAYIPINESFGVHGLPLNQGTQSILFGDPSLSGYKQVYEYMINGQISPNKTASYYSMTTEFDPFYKNAIDFVDDFRGYLYDSCDKYGYTDLCYLTGGSVGEVDMVKKIYENIGWILSIIIGTVFCLMGIVFKSLFVPFRLFITITIPMAFIYGLSIMVYQNGLLSFLNLSSVSNTNGLFWLIPVMTITILIGLALDYDIFLFARIYEYRIMGQVTTHQSIIRGVYKSGSIITAAGLIMAISFLGLIFSEITALNQTAFILVVGVLVDTFIIRTALVPAVLSIAKEINWWPGSTLNKKTRTASFSDNNDNEHDSRQMSQLQNLNMNGDVDETM